MVKKESRQKVRVKKHNRMRNRFSGTAERPRLAVFRSNNHMYAQVHVYDGNGDEILTYTVGVGWHEKESKAETQVHGALKAAYYDAYHAARQEINSGAVEMQGGFDARA